ncbi:MAG TPA: GatB/YqeY domain-containing protein [Hyphomicrobiaceae bacterium]|nr:GatB/YqeY domain-containing protein [Hyphomicrobiaceae bacterium]
MREKINEAMKAALRSGDKARLGTLRLMLAAIKDRELGIGTGGQAQAGAPTDADIVQVLQKMVKQRRDSIATYKQGNRQDLADKEAAEIAVIEEFLPRQMSEAEAKAAIAAVVKEMSASGPKDMGRVMGALKSRYTGQMDFAKASALVKELLK